MVPTGRVSGMRSIVTHGIGFATVAGFIHAPALGVSWRLRRVPRMRMASKMRMTSQCIRVAVGLLVRAVAAAREPAGVNWRFRVPDGEAIGFEDSGVGARSYVAGRDFGDFVVWRRDDVPAYQLACVVDDGAMQITEVVRGADLLRSTARQLLLYRALGLTAPKWHHCPLLRDASGQRLAKRTDALSLRALRERGMSAAEVRAMWGRQE